MVRRIASRRTNVRSSYNARSRSVGLNDSTRARAERYTVAGSVEWSTTMPRAASSTVAADADGARRWRTASRARRSSTETRLMSELEVHRNRHAIHEAGDVRRNADGFVRRV